jgi:hypothetical protein
MGAGTQLSRQLILAAYGPTGPIWPLASAGSMHHRAVPIFDKRSDNAKAVRSILRNHVPCIVRPRGPGGRCPPSRCGKTPRRLWCAESVKERGKP